jgi:hypothetical protein
MTNVRAELVVIRDSLEKPTLATLSTAVKGICGILIRVIEALP